MHTESIGFEHCAGEMLGKKVGQLVCSFDCLQLKLFCVLPKPMPFIQEVAGAVGDAMVLGQEVCSHIIFEDAGVKGTSEVGRKAEMIGTLD